jgi:hypothetical protein
LSGAQLCGRLAKRAKLAKPGFRPDTICVRGNWTAISRWSGVFQVRVHRSFDGNCPAMVPKASDTRVYQRSVGGIAPGAIDSTERKSGVERLVPP